jgi:hypothetical protein
MLRTEPDGRKPGVSRLLIRTALDPDLCRRLLSSPGEVFEEFDLTEEERELLKQPDHRLLRLLGAALAEEVEESSARSQAPAAVLQPAATMQAHVLPDISLVLTLVPCAQYENGQLHNFAYAAWVNPLPLGADPASFALPEGVELPGRPLKPLHAVIHVSAVQMQDAAGSPQVGLSAALLQSANFSEPAPAGAAANLDSPEVHAAIAGVRTAPRELRYGRLIELMHALDGHAFDAKETR